MSPEAEQSQKRDWRVEIGKTLAAIPRKPLFAVLLLAWVLLFYFLGNSTQGYIKSASLFNWMGFAYEMGPDDRHGYVIPFAVLGFLWWKRRDFTATISRAWWPALGVVVLAILIHALGFMVQQNRISIVAFCVGLWGLVGTVWGPEVMRRTFFPFVLFVFCVPLASATDTLTFPLRKIATVITVKICNFFSVAVQQHGTTMIDPHGRYQYDVAAACSGIRSLTAICVITAAYAFVFFTKTWKRAVVLFLAIPLAVFSNVLRLLTVVIASELAGVLGRSPQAAGEYVHDSTIISLLPYVVAFFGVFMVARWLKEDREVDIAEVAIPVGIAVAIPMMLGAVLRSTVEYNYNAFTTGGFSTGGPGWMLIVLPYALVVVLGIIALRTSPVLRNGLATCLAALLMIGVAAGFLSYRQKWQRLSAPGVKVVAEPQYVTSETNRFLAGTNSVYLPQRVLRYDSHPIPLSNLVYEWLPKDTTYGQRRYFINQTNGFWLDNMVVLMGADRTSIHNPRYCLAGQGFQIVSEQTDSIRISKPVTYDLPVKKLTLRGHIQQGDRRDPVGGVMIYWFVSETNLSAEHGQRMWQMGYDLVRTGVLERWAYVICMAYALPGQEDATYERLKEFIRASVPEYQLTTGKPLYELSDLGAAK